MRILYSIQATGNGHISRAMELLPHLKNYGEVDIFLSGNNSHLPLDAPIRYRSKGLSLFYNCSGGLDYWKMLRGFHPIRLRQEIRDLPVEKYDLVINDFEYITAAACARKGVYSVNYGHQASFISPLVPRPDQRKKTGEYILKNYARATDYVGLHFRRYDDFIFTPVVKQAILDAEPTDQGYITVYLPAYCAHQLRSALSDLSDHRFQVFSSEFREPTREGNIEWMPVSKEGFNQSLIHCRAIVCGAGFETPAEALQLGKKVLAIPIRHQYEQECNAAALKEMGVATTSELDHQFRPLLEDLLMSSAHPTVDYRHSIDQSLAYLFARRA